MGAMAFGAKSADAVSPVVQGNTAFALDFYQRERTQDGNLFFSPYSISTALAMTYAGARGQTEREMAKVLHCSVTQEELARSFASLAERFGQIQKQKQVNLSVANSLWCERKYTFTEAFLELNRKHFGAEVQLLDFSGHPDQSREEINAWVERKTQNRIQNLLQPPNITPFTTLVLCNAIYFKGNWLTQFDPKATTREPFFQKTTQKAEVPMMTAELKVRSYKAKDAVLFALPYAGNDLSMAVILPEQLDGLKAVEDSLNAPVLQEWLSALDASSETKATIVLPKFKLNLRLELSKTLKSMGMASAFGGGADFSGMSPSKDLSISEVVHQAFLDVNEEGTEAAAATAVVMSRLAAHVSPQLLLRADHPFLFLIRERQTGSILFLGRLVDPTN